MLNVRQPLDRRRSSVSTAPSATSNRPALRSKFSVSYEALLAGEQPWQAPQHRHDRYATPHASSSSSSLSSSGKKSSAPRARYFADLLCLSVEPETLSQLVADVPAATLVDEDEASRGARIRDNVGSLWRECLRLWADVPSGHSSGFGMAGPGGDDGDDDDVTGSVGMVRRVAARSGVESSDEVRRNNAVDTLVYLSRPLLAKQFSHASTSLDLISIFAGSIDEADEVFETLVACIDEGIRGELDDPRLSPRKGNRRSAAARMPSSTPADDFGGQTQTSEQAALPSLAEIFNHRLKATRLAVIWISHVSTTNLAAYFVRRDLFVAAGTSLSLVQSIAQNVQAARKRGQEDLLLSDEDEELLREVVRETTLLFGLLAGLGQGTASSTSTSSGMYAAHFGGAGGGGGGGSCGGAGMSASNSPYFRRLCDWVDSGSMALVRDVAAADLETSWKAYEQVSSSPGSNSQAAPTAANYAIGGLAEGVKRLGFSTSTASGNSIEAASSSPVQSLPLPVTSTLLPIFLLTRANEAFVDIALRTATSDTDTSTILAPKDQTFSAALLSLASYLATHASTSNRSRSYARLSLLAQLSILSSKPGVEALILSDRSEEVAKVSLCTQRAGPRPIKSPSASTDSLTTLRSLLTSRTYVSGTDSKGQQAADGAANVVGAKTRLVANILDSVCQFLRFNMRKRLDVPAYLIALQVLNLILEAFSTTSPQRRTRLEYVGWTEMWRTLTSVATFLAGRYAELKGVETNQLGQALLSTLSLAVLGSDRVLPSSHDVNLLLYEVIRSGEALRRLALVLSTAGGGSSSGGRSASPSTNGNATPTHAGSIGRTAIAGYLDGVPGWRLLEAVLNAFEDRLAEWDEAKRSKSKGFLAGYFDFAAPWSSASTKTASADGVSGEAAEAVPQGRSSPSQQSQSKQAMPDVNTVLQLIATLDMEWLTTLYSLPPSNLAAAAPRTSSYVSTPGGSTNAPWPASAPMSSTPTTTTTTPFGSSSQQQQQYHHHRVHYAKQLHHEWLERAEAQCLSEALRFAAEDMRAVVVTPLPLSGA